MEKEPEYLSDFSLSCRATVSRKIFPDLLPYMTLILTTSSDTNVSNAIPTDEDILKLTLFIPTLNGTHNGVYTCHLVLNLPKTERLIVKQFNYSLHVQGITINVN